LPFDLNLLQILDYGITMKLDDGEYAVQMLYRMLKLLMMLTRGKSHVYIQSIIMQLLVLRHQRNNQTSAWQMLMGSLSTFNEEAGEISFGMLARSILGDTQKGKFAHLNKLYQQIHFYGQLETELGSEGAGFTKNGNWRKKIDPEGELVTSIAHFVNQLVRQMRQKAFRVYGGKPSGYKNAGPALQTYVNVSNPVPLWVFDIEVMLDVQMEKCKDKFLTFFVEPYSDIWPECRHHPEMPILQRQHQLRQVIRERRHERKLVQEAATVISDELKHADGPDVLRPSTRKTRRTQNVANSEDDSDLHYSASSDSEEGEDAVPPGCDNGEDEEPANVVYHADWSNVDHSNIMDSVPGERQAELARKKRKTNEGKT
jgi:hypothetical protein